MKSDDVLDALADVAREEDVPSPRERKLEALALGKLDPDELTALENEAESDEELARELAAHRPLNVTEREQIANRVLTLLKPQKESEPVAEVRVIAPRRLRSARVGMVLAGLAAAAAIALAVGRGPAPLPGYQMTLSGGVQETRGEPQKADNEVVLAPSSRLSIVLRPATRVEGTVAAHAFELVDGVPRALPIEPKISGEGAVLIEGGPGDLFGEARGKRRLLLVVGRTESVSSKARASELAARGAHEGTGYQVLATDVMVTTP